MNKCVDQLFYSRDSLNIQEIKYKTITNVAKHEKKKNEEPNIKK